MCVCVCVCGGGGGGCSQFLRINITPNRNRKSCYSLRTFMRSCKTAISYFTNGNDYNEFIAMFYIQA